MNANVGWSRALRILGCITMALGTVDPMEGSVLILIGSGLIALGSFLGKNDHRAVLYWTGVFISIAVGVAALFGLSAVGGIGGRSGRSMWWGLLILPYPVGWLMALAAGVIALVRLFKARAA